MLHRFNLYCCCRLEWHNVCGESLGCGWHSAPSWTSSGWGSWARNGLGLNLRPRQTMCVTAFDVRSRFELSLGTKRVMKGLCRSTSLHLLLDRKLISFVIFSSYSFISSRGDDFNVLCTCSKCRHCQYLTVCHAVRHLETEITAEQSYSDV